MNDSLETLLADGIIEAVIGQLKTGKEAEVWLVQHAGEVVAAKLYKERHERNFRNNVGYREGREVRNSRTRRAMEKGSRFGQAATDDAWKSAESDSLYKLHALGVRVPTPVLFYEGILLMELVLDADGRPAPRLVEAPPTTPEQAHALYLDLRSQVVGMLCADLIHGDLSPYNILMSWQGAIIIDFPQTVAAARNNRAEFYFRRDLDNVRNFLAGIEPRLYDADGDTSEIWNAYVRRELTPDFTPKGGFRAAPRKGGFKAQRDASQAFVPEPALAAPVPVARSTMTPEEAEEAELRELEALVLKQGGGERGKPAAAPPPRGGRNRSGGGRPPPRAGGNRPAGAGGNGPRPPMGGSGARPPPGGQRTGTGGGPPQASGPRGGGTGRPGPNEQRAGGNPGGARTNPGARSNEPRGGNPQGARFGEPRGGNNPGARSNEPRGGNVPGVSGSEPRRGSAQDARFSEPRGGPPPGARFSEPRGGNNPGARFNEQPTGGGEGTGWNEPRGGDAPAVSSASNEQRAEGGRPARSEQRPGGNGRPPRGEQRPGGNGRPPRNDPRTGDTGFATTSEPRAGTGAPPRDEPRGNGAPPRGEPRGGNTPRGERRGGPGRQQPGGETRPATATPPSGPATNNLREPRSGGPGNGQGPRQPRQGPNRGGPHAPRASGPQVSFVGRPPSSSDPEPHETGS